jgi:hypothetical protein
MAGSGCTPQTADNRTCDDLTLLLNSTVGCLKLEAALGLDCSGCRCNPVVVSDGDGGSDDDKGAFATTVGPLALLFTDKGAVAMWMLVACGVVIVAFVVAVLVHKVAAQKVVLPQNERWDLGLTAEAAMRKKRADIRAEARRRHPPGSPGTKRAGGGIAITSYRDILTAWVRRRRPLWLVALSSVIGWSACGWLHSLCARPISLFIAPSYSARTHTHTHTRTHSLSMHALALALTTRSLRHCTPGRQGQARRRGRPSHCAARLAFGWLLWRRAGRQETQRARAPQPRTHHRGGRGGEGGGRGRRGGQGTCGRPATTNNSQSTVVVIVAVVVFGCCFARSRVQQ